MRVVRDVRQIYPQRFIANRQVKRETKSSNACVTILNVKSNIDVFSKVYDNSNNTYVLHSYMHLFNLFYPYIRLA